ncbi:hypothetical protein [Arthrobacter sp. B3I4]|uniref:hypothetical protein n=1 Tax=Arthrobacter sp. B3I4 TaxID=3042267 RepID=UPI002783C479|nr:hypothetical protein [Arthrobacter sp. B3I4]MDQ0756782.1 hypothetical protein [Arthrobacter sp. B3I4]
MTHSAVHQPVDDHDGGRTAAGASRTGEDPRGDAPRREQLPWKGLAAIAAAGVPVGLLWWLLAPTGMNLLTRNPALDAGSNPETWLPRDLVLAGLTLLAGCLAGVLIAGNRPERLVTGTVLLAVAAGAAGALLAWGTGLAAGSWWGAAADASANPSIAFSLRAYAVLLIWPAATALAIFFATVFARPGHSTEPEQPLEREQPSGQAA